MRDIEDFYPLSPMQQGILFHSLYAPKSGAYFDQFNCPIHGNLNPNLFKRAWEQVLRHPILRTSFVWEGLKEPAQVVHRQVTLPWEELDWRGFSSVEQQEQLEAVLKAERKRGFELSQAPLIRLTLIQLAEENYRFIWNRHHLLLDGWSSSLLFEEVFAYYKAFSQDENLHLQRPRPYRDYIVWLQQQDLSQTETFWRQLLKGFTAVTSLRVDQTFSRSPLAPPLLRGAKGEQNQYDKQQIQLSAATTAALQSLARQQQLTLNTLVQGAWALLLGRYSAEDDVVFGAVVSGRPPILAGAESMVGLFINTLPVRVQIEPKESLLPWLKKIQAQQTTARQYEYSPLMEVLGWSDMPRGLPLFESILSFQNYPVDFSSRSRGGNLEIPEIHTFAPTHYPLTVLVAVHSELSLKIIYDCHRFDAATINRMLGHFQTLLEGIAANPNQRLSDLPILTEAERKQLLVDWNDTHTNYPKHQCINELFEAQVERTPDAVAVVFVDALGSASRRVDQQLTYRELNCCANQLAHHLRSLGVGPEVLVGICVERSLEMVIGLLGVLKAGGGYVPLDPAYPQERLAFMLEDAAVPVLLTQQQLVATLPEHRAKVICLDSDWQSIAQESSTNLVSGATTANLAYVIYTSGSTGKPKGVQIPHRAVVNFLNSMRLNPGLTDRDILLSVTTLSFDIAALELFLPLIVGASAVVVSRQVASNGGELLKQLRHSGATVMQATPATWQLLLEAGWSRSQQLKILCGGEALHRQLANELLERSASLWNLYGPTETTIWSTIHQIDSRNGPIPIGRPIANTQVYILDRYLQPVPIGVPGELYIGGDGLARGYLNRPELTDERFIPNPFSEPSARLYKTGDLARYLPNGDIEYLGRIDHQVKVRGFRIELGEIEAVLCQHPNVQTAVVSVREDEPGNKRLVGYVVPHQEQGKQGEQGENSHLTPHTSPSLLRDFLKEKLPDYMVPSAFVLLEALPLTPNGKVDRRALPAPDTTRPELESTFVAPRTPVEEVLAGIWAQVLALQQVSINDNFFDLGGHSLLATQLISRVGDTFRVELPLRCLFEAPTVAELAASIETMRREGQGPQAPPILPAPRDKELPLSFAQQRLWFLDQLEPGTSTYNVPASVLLTGSLNAAALEQSFNEVIKRHEALRTTFATVEGGRPVQVIKEALALAVPVVDLQDIPDTEREAEARRLVIEKAQVPFDLEQGPLLRVTLLRLSQEEHVMLLTMHHIVSDAWSMGVLIREIAAFYEAFSSSKPSPLPELPIQYADFAVWQRQWLQGEVLEAKLAYWKQQLGGILPVLQLPTDRPRLAVKTRRGATQSFLLSSKLEELQALSRKETVTLFMTLLAAFQALLHRYTNQDDIVVGTDVANRNRIETESLIGFFVNLLILRTDLSGNPTFRELLGRVRKVALGAYAHQDLPFEKLVEALRPERNSSHTPLFQVLFVLQNAPMPPLELPGLTLRLLEVDNETSKFDLALFLTETERGLVATWQYNADLFEATTIARISAHFATLLDSIVAQPDARLNALEMLTETEREQGAVEKTEQKALKLKKFMNVKPKAVNLSQERLIKTDYLQPGETLPLVIQPDVDDIDLVEWVQSNREFIETNLLKHGAILFRGFKVNSVPEFENFAQAICPKLFGEYGDLPREGISSKVYGSTPYPSDQAILFHNESSHLHRWPMKIWFFCVQPAQQGGETPIVDSRKIFQLLDPKIRARFQQKQLMYVRNYTDNLDVSWQEFFHTTDKSVVEDYCRQACINFEWKDNGLRTRQVRPAVTKHPKTDELVFFNQIQLHHISCLDPAVRESLLSLFGEENLPRHVYYGDRTPIEDSVIDEIQAVYREATISFPWRKGDVLMLDNMLTAHGRNPYVGSRKIVVAMGEMMTQKQMEQRVLEEAHAQ